MSKFAHRKDANQDLIVEALTMAGYTVDDMAGAGARHPGFPDLICYTKTNPAWGVYLEVKRPGERLNRNEERWRAEHPDVWYQVVSKPEHALQVMYDATHFLIAMT